MKEVQKLFSKIEVLPPSPSLLPKLLPALSDVNANFDEVVEMVELDPALTAKLLQICNSAFFGSANPVSNVREAVNQAGYQSVYLLVAMLDGGECFKSPDIAGLNSKILWKHSVTAAYATRAVAETADLEGGMMFTAGLLHDIGKVVLARARGPEYGLLLIRAAQANTSAFMSENTTYGYNHADVGASLLERWELPESLVAGVRFHHEPTKCPGDNRRIAACVYLGDFLAHIEENPQLLENPDFNLTLAMMNFTNDDVRAWRKRLEASRSVIDSMSRTQGGH